MAAANNSPYLPLVTKSQGPICLFSLTHRLLFLFCRLRISSWSLLRLSVLKTKSRNNVRRHSEAGLGLEMRKLENKTKLRIYLTNKKEEAENINATDVYSYVYEIWCKLVVEDRGGKSTDCEGNRKPFVNSKRCQSVHTVRVFSFSRIPPTCLEGSFCNTWMLAPISLRNPSCLVFGRGRRVRWPCRSPRRILPASGVLPVLWLHIRALRGARLGSSRTVGRRLCIGWGNGQTM